MSEQYKVVVRDRDTGKESVTRQSFPKEEATRIAKDYVDEKTAAYLRKSK